ncbi:MAG: hypothetical protein A3F41_05890 [Coxiella sp. RIFCSPHIGHO2_12_FULL_44_14]|nr:MAG: hypothetical protein A3F41_05890 [Coxiella sp. RIFCSPHIGHO2_12_FULL_44_14]
MANTLLLMVGILALILSETAIASLVVIGSPEIQVDHLTQHQVENIYLGKPAALSTQEQLQPFDQSDDSSAYQQFYQSLLGWSPDQVSSYWSSLVFQGEGNPPPKVSDDMAAIAAVERTPQSIAYVDSQDLENTEGQVKVLYQFGPLNHFPVTASSHTTVPPMVNAGAAQEVAAINASLAAYSVGNHTPASLPTFQSDTSLPSNLSQLQYPNSATSGANLWPIIVSHFALNDYSDLPAVRYQILAFLSNKKILNQILRNAVPYIYYVYQQTEERHMPAEFALLPMLESGYDPFAYSSAGASGLWQLMPGTASSFGLEIDWWYDARRDTLVSTQAALNYMCNLHDAFHDWLLAAAAYDAGIGVVQDAQQNNANIGQGTDFWDLPLPDETKAYVPKLLALAAIVKDPARYGVILPYVPNKSYFTAVHVNSQIDMAEAASLSGVPQKVIRHLNSSLRRWATTPGEVHTWIIPNEYSAQFGNNLEKLQGQEHTSWEYHQVQGSETLQSIAHNYHTTVSLLMHVNGLTSDVLNPDTGLLVPLRLHRTYGGTLALPATTTTLPIISKPVVATGNNTDSLKRLIDKIYFSRSSS